MDDLHSWIFSHQGEIPGETDRFLDGLFKGRTTHDEKYWRNIAMKIGRNDPCPCGSGKKYKKCCLLKAETPSQTLYYRRLSEAHDRLADRLIAYAAQTFGEDAVDVAMHEFLMWPDTEDEISEEMLDRADPLFWPWYVFNWEYDPIDAEVELAGPEGRTVAELYAEERSGKLDTLERRLIDSINRKPYSFLEVLSVDKGKGMTLQDILKGARIEVQERSGSEYVQSGDLLFGRAVLVDGVGMLIGLAATILPPGRKPDIIQLRKRLRHDRSAITDNTLYDWDTEIRDLYFDIDRALHGVPQLCNTDGHPLEFHRLIYDISSPDEIFEKLCDLCVTTTPEELCADAERDDVGRIIKVEIPWDRQGHKASPGMPNTILGRIVINGHRLTAEVNSAERTEALRREIDTRLGDSGRFKFDEIQDLDALMSRPTESSAQKKHSKEHEDLMQYPEVQDQVAEMMGKHWESWVDQITPALGGKSPREAVETADGCEAVEALLKDAERARGQDPFTMELNRKGTQRVREMLGLNHRIMPKETTKHQDLEEIEYRKGMLAEGINPDNLPAKVWRGPEISADVKKAINDENLLNLGGIYGDKNAGDPVEYDNLKLVLPDDTVEITVFNRGITLFTSDDEKVRRIHRVLCKLDESGKA